MAKDSKSAPTENPMRTEYETPQVERVMDAEELSREVHYAGAGVGPGIPAISPT